MQETLSKTQNAQRNKELVGVILTELINLDEEIENMSEDEKKIEKPYE